MKLAPESFTSKNSDTFITGKERKINSRVLFHDKITNAELVNFKLGKLFSGCNIPFSVVESVYFKKFCQLLRPACKPPSRTILLTRVLNEIHNTFCVAIISRAY